MPTAQMTEKRNAIPAGDYILCLISVESKMQPSFEDPTQETERWIWQFKSNTKDPETGDRYEFRQYTGPRYGHPRAGLTLLLDQMLPDWSEIQKGSIDTDKILNTYYKARIRHEKAEKVGDPPKPRLVMIEPYQQKSAKTEETTPLPAEKPRTYARPQPEPVNVPINVPEDFDTEEDDPFDE